MKIGNTNIVVEECLYCRGYGSYTDVPEPLKQRFNTEGFVEITIENHTHVFVKTDSTLVGKNIQEESIIYMPRMCAENEDKVLQSLVTWCTVGKDYRSVAEYIRHEVKGDTLTLLYAPYDDVEVLGYGSCTNIDNKNLVILDDSIFRYDSDWVGFDLDGESVEDMLAENRDLGMVTYAQNSSLDEMKDNS